MELFTKIKTGSRGPKAKVGRVLCVECGEEKDRKVEKRVTVRKVQLRTVFVDSLGKQWNGLQCPQCKYGSI